MKRRSNLAADVLNRAFPSEYGQDGVALTSAAHPPGALEAMCAAITNGPLTVRWQQCNRCGWRLPDGAAGVPECKDCGGPMHIHLRPA